MMRVAGGGRGVQGVEEGDAELVSRDLEVEECGKAGDCVGFLLDAPEGGRSGLEVVGVAHVPRDIEGTV